MSAERDAEFGKAVESIPSHITLSWEEFVSALCDMEPDDSDKERLDEKGWEENKTSLLKYFVLVFEDGGKGFDDEFDEELRVEEDVQLASEILRAFGINDLHPLQEMEIRRVVSEFKFTPQVNLPMEDPNFD